MTTVTAGGGILAQKTVNLGSQPNIFAVCTQLRLVFSFWVRYQMAMSDDSFENLAKKLAESVPDVLRSVRDDLETNFRSVLKTGIGKLDLVTREEFEVQEAVLARTREKLDTLEAKLEELEKTIPS